MSRDRESAREWIRHHLQEASGHAEEAGEKEAQAKIDELIRLLRDWWKLPDPPCLT